MKVSDACMPYACTQPRCGRGFIQAVKNSPLAVATGAVILTAAICIPVVAIEGVGAGAIVGGGLAMIGAVASLATYVRSNDSTASSTRVRAYSLSNSEQTQPLLDV